MSASNGQRRLVVIKNCTQDCPHVITERTRGAGYALDYKCSAVKGNPMIAGYIEWPSELPKDGEFPRFCPLYEAEPGMYEGPNVRE